ncbi:hypothetical protein RSWS8N_19234 [Cereibacter sphaeroides WS8N]|uniref:Mu transposase C-terminal domain-containing protein n=1 Tax=Cereibacter sphaeroides TaxID=1063 RepID=UPI00020B0404|nr:Mu transposase C-terminal domain-containing protein [Cereibacter sphaeroides]EGJ20325.1 hypothetical protein RSWS8N_19234 [Cereibacter sphaeroides WS8N]
MNACVQHFHFEPGALIAYEGYEVVVTGSVRGGIAVRDRWLGADETVRHYVLSDAKIQELLLRPDVVIDAAFSVDGPGDLPVVSTETAFADCPAEQRRTALQKEAFCLAARTVLKGGPYHPSRIEEHLADIIRLALDRQRLNGLGQQRNGRFEGRTWGPRSISNFCKAYFGMRQPHPRALLDRISAGNRTRRLTPAQDALLDECCHAWLSTAQPSGASIVRLVERRFRAARAERLRHGDTQSFTTPHPNTIYRRLKRFPRLEVVAGREGFRAAQKEFSPTQHGVRALKPGELIELDFWKGDVFTFSEQSKFWDLLTPDLQKLLKDGKPTGRKKERQRLWICIAIDVATRMVLGVGIAEKPNERTVIEVLDMVMRDKSDISRLAGCKMPMSQHCGLGTVIFDTGNEFFNEVVQTAILAAGGSFIYGRAAVPMDKPFVERFFGGLRTLFADELPGKTGFSADCLVGYDKEGMAAFNAEEFRHLLIRYLVDHYPLRRHAGLVGKRPIDAWKDAQKYGVLPPPPLRVRRNATGLRVMRMLTKEGVKICGLPFGDPSLFPRHIRNGKVPVEVRIDPNDLREVTILVDGQQIHLANQRPDLGHHSIRTLMAAIKEMTASRPQDRDFYEHVLADYADDFARKIETGIRKHGLPSTEITPEQLDWFESSFCLRLNVIRTPEATRSADMGDLLAGRTGAGIHSAADIAAERTAEAEAAQPEPEPDGALPPPDAPEPEPPTAADPPARRGRKPAPKPDPSPPAGGDAPQPAPGRRFSGAPKGKGRFT